MTKESNELRKQRKKACFCSFTKCACHRLGKKEEQIRILKLIRRWLYGHCKYDIIVPDEDWEDIKKLIKGDKT